MRTHIRNRLPAARILAAAFALALLLSLPFQLLAEDWPIYRKDRLRTATTAEQLKLPLNNVWLFRSRVSWKAPAVQRSTVDRETPNALYNGKHTWSAPATPDESRWALPITSAGDSLFFTSHDGRIVCLSAKSGEVRWQYLTAAAITQAANYYDGRIYAGSDDGYVYCLSADTGKLTWKYKAAPADRWLISYGRMASLWPVRTDVMVDAGVAYFAAGVFPHDGIYLHALRADKGESVWQQGGVPFGGCGISGYPVLTTSLYCCPVDLKGFNRSPVFRRSDGVYDWTGSDPEKQSVHFGKGDGRETQDLGVFRDGVQYLGSWAKKRAANGKETSLWSIKVDRWYDPSKGILVGDTLFYLADDKAIWGAPLPQGGEGGAVIARNAATGQQLWSFDIPERPHDIIAANGRLFVSTRNGTIYCFAPPGEQAHGVVKEPLKPEPFEPGQRLQASKAAAKQIASAAGMTAGYAVVLDCEDGSLAYQLATTTDLYVVAVFANAEKAQAARERFASADLHGSRVIVWHGQPGERLPVPSRVADLVTSEATLTGGPLPASLDEVTRMLKPIRGTALFYSLQQKQSPHDWQPALKQRTDGGEAWTQVANTEGWSAKFVRPPVPNSGGWAGPRGGPANTNNSHDAALKGPLGVVWYGAPSVQSGNYAPPLVVNGVLLCPLDEDTLAAHDQYNGRLLWNYTAAGIGSSVFANGIAGGDYLYTIHDGRCLRIKLYEGGEPQEVPTPFGGGKWAAVSVSPDGKTLWGAARQMGDKQQLLWAGIFALDVPTNRPLWKLSGPDAIADARKAGMTKVKLWQSWNAIGDGRMYIIGPIEDATRKQAIDETRAYFAKQSPDQLESFDKEIKADQRALRTLTALDAQTGKHLYDHGIDMTHNALFAAHAGYVIGLATDHMDRHRKNPLGGPPTQGLGVWEGKTGQLVWKRPGAHSFTPVVTGTTIFAEPWAYDLKTGQHTKRLDPANGLDSDFCWTRNGKHCGGYNGSEYFLFGRNMGVGYYDTLRDNGMYTFWHSRIACETDVATGGGMMIKPPYALGCICPWSLPFTIALAPSDHEPEASFDMALSGNAAPVNHVRFNFGAEGDRRDRDGNLWIRPGKPSLTLFNGGDFAVSAKWTRYPGVNEFHSFVRRSNVFTKIENTDVDFVFACGERGIQRCVIPLSRPDGPKGDFKIRFGFCGLPGEQVGQRVFDIRLNGQTVEEKFDALKVAGGPDRAIWREFLLTGEREAVIEFIAADPSPTLEKLPILNALEVIRRGKP
ncbi:MAG: PQQ-binding-like beta-propeller repeat protein [Planctomycetia bacterium]|nr:PQQ-binding-like beta-propeller repeat protein [Planctomycetia bacterium]